MAREWLHDLELEDAALAAVREREAMNPVPPVDEDTSLQPPVCNGRMWEIWRANGVLAYTFHDVDEAWRSYSLMCEDEGDDGR